MSLGAPFLIGLAPTPTAVEAAARTSTDVGFTIVLSSDAGELVLSRPWTVLAGAEGLDDIEPDVITEDYPGVNGVADGGVSVGGRDVWLPLHLACGSGAEWETQRAALRRVVNGFRGLTSVTVVRPDGSWRRVTGRGVVRAPSWDVDTWSVRGWQRLGVLVRGLSPWWSSDDGVLIQLTGAPTVGWFDAGVWGEMQLAPDSSFGTPVTVDVPGDVETWPVVTVTGPAGLVTVTHEGTGRSWQVDCTGLTGPVTVDTDPTTSAITDGAGADRWSILAPPGDLWPLDLGVQQVTVTATGTTADTLITLRAARNHLAAVA